jgi:hypothetical protein
LWWAMTSSYQQTPLRKHGARGSNNDVEPCRNAEERRVLEPRFWRDRQGVSELLAALAAQEARSGLSHLAKKLAGLRASDAHHESASAASPSRLGSGCRA